jgi:hypothetical protein
VRCSVTRTTPPGPPDSRVKLTKSLPSEVDANGDDIYEPCANVEPVDVIDESQSYSINCSTCDATLEPEVWHILDTFENMFFQKN